MSDHNNSVEKDGKAYWFNASDKFNGKTFQLGDTVPFSYNPDVYGSDQYKDDVYELYEESYNSNQVGFVVIKESIITDVVFVSDIKVNNRDWHEYEYQILDDIRVKLYECYEIQDRCEYSEMATFEYETAQEILELERKLKFAKSALELGSYDKAFSSLLVEPIGVSLNYQGLISKILMEK